MTLEDSEVRCWGADTLATREGRGGRRGWLTTPAQLLAGARQLDPTAISALYAIYRGPLLSFLRQEGAGPLAEDVTQGFFARAWQKGDFAKLQPVGSFGAWLRSGALHQLYNDRKRANARKRRLGAPETAALQSEWAERHAPESDRLLDQRRTALLIERAWARLRESYQRLGRELLFDHLVRTLSRDDRTAGEAADTMLCQQLGISANYLAVRRHHLKHEEFPAALRAELHARRAQERTSGQLRQRATPTMHEELRALLDDL